MTLKAFIEALVAAGTLGLAVAAFWQLKGGRAALDLTKQSVAATRDAITASIRPTVALTLCPASDAHPLGKAMVLRVDNKGAGPAILRHVTGRDDVQAVDLLSFALKDHVLGARESETLVVPCRHEEFTDRDGSRVTSLSLWYQDLASNWFRVRILLSFRKAPNLKYQVIAVEHVDYTGAPHISSDQNDSDYVCKIEGGWTAIHHPGLADLYMLTTQDRLIRKSYPGSEATNGKAVELLGISFFSGAGWPTLSLRVEGHQAFDLTWAAVTEARGGAVEITDVGERSKAAHGGWSVQDNVADRSDIERLGLRNSTQLPSELSALYRSLMGRFGDGPLWKL